MLCSAAVRISIPLPAPRNTMENHLRIKSWGAAGMPRSGSLVGGEATATLVLWEEQHSAIGIGAEEVAAVLGTPPLVLQGQLRLPASSTQ